MRVLIVSDCYAPRLGGIETQVQDLARNLLAAGHEPAVVTATPAGAGRGLGVERPDGFPVYRVTAPLPAQLPEHPRAGAHLRRLMRRLRPDVVHVHVGIVSPFAWSGIRQALGLGLPVAVTFHCVLGPWARAGRLAGPASPVSRWRRAGADLTAVSGMLAAEVSRAGGNGQVAVLPNGIDLSAWRPPSGSPRPDREGVRVVASLRWIARKCPLEVIEVFSRAVEMTGDTTATLTVYGDGPLRRRMHQVAAASPLRERITLAGRVDRAQLAADYAQADVYLQTSPADSFGIAALEGRCAGLAVVGVASSGVADFVTDGEDGYLADDVEGLARALAGLLRSPQELARVRAHNLTHDPLPVWHRAVELNVEAYRRAQVLARARRSSRR